MMKIATRKSKSVSRDRNVPCLHFCQGAVRIKPKRRNGMKKSPLRQSKHGRVPAVMAEHDYRPIAVSNVDQSSIGTRTVSSEYHSNTRNRCAVDYFILVGKLPFYKVQPHVCTTMFPTNHQRHHTI
jgi:hypothetical protein